MNVPNNSPIQRRRINFDEYLDNQQTRSSVEKFIDNLTDGGCNKRKDDIETSAAVEEEKVVDQGDGRGVVEEEEVVHNNHLISSRYDMYSSSSSESSDSESNSDSDYRETGDENDNADTQIVSER